MEPIKESQSEKKLSEMDIQDLVVKTYNKVAIWHNDDSSKAGLKLLSCEIVEEIAGAVFNHFGLTYTSEIKMDTILKKKIEEEKRKSGTYLSKNVNEMTDEELLNELKKRKNNS